MLTKYIIREILSHFVYVFGVVVGLLFLTKAVDFVPELYHRGGTWQDFLLFSGYLWVFLWPFALPLAALAGVILTFMRLSHDQELLALSSLGISPRRLLKPVLLFCGGLFFLTTTLNIFFFPVLKREMRDILFEAFKRRLARGLPEKEPVDWFPGLLFYAERVKDGFRFRHVYLFDEREKERLGLIYARRGRLELQEGEVLFVLREGEGHYFSPDLVRVENFYFGEYRYRLSLESLEGRREFKRGELNLKALWERAHDTRLPLKKRRRYLTEFYQRIFHPLSVLILPLVGLPLGARLKASGRGLALAVGLLVYLFYYLLFTFGTTLAESGRWPPPLALGMAPAVFLGVAGLLFWRFERTGR